MRVFERGVTYDTVSFVLLILLLSSPAALAVGAESVCYGTASHGRLENGVRLPMSGPNFQTYSWLASITGRTYVHSKVRDIVVATYEALEKTLPRKTYVYGETGWASGGSFRPHKTHQNGLSVDFMVPVIDQTGKSVPLPTNVFNKFGYGTEFDASGQYNDYKIDFETMAEHLHRLHRVAIAHEADIQQVVFDPTLQPPLLRTKRGPYLKQYLNLSLKPSWIRHDQHYHVDFLLECRPLYGQ